MTMKKYVFIYSFLFLWVAYGFSQEKKFSTFYYQRATLFEELPVTSEDIIFLGNSITNGCEWSELFGNSHVKNRGISGDITEGVYARLDPILRGKPAKIFLLIGINDVERDSSVTAVLKNTRMIIDKIKKESPSTRLYVQSILPVSDHYKMFSKHTAHWQMIPEINAGLQQLTSESDVNYIDLYSHFVDKESGKMNVDYSNDGLHLLGKGYLLWRDIVEPYVNE